MKPKKIVAKENTVLFAKDLIDFTLPVLPCRVYWGSHGCRLERGHKGWCKCDCCLRIGETEADGVVCVAEFPYYGPETWFYGEDVEARGLPVNPGANWG